MFVHLTLVREPWPGPRWQAFFERVWPLYKRWFVSEGEAARPDRRSSVAHLAEHMPELLPVYEALCARAGHDDLADRFLALWCPPAYMAGCSVLACTGEQPLLVRNYDFDPRFFDGRLTYTEYCKPVIGMQDSAWGLLDGINADGLAVALAFGGRKIVGTGFGIPLVLRYVLETCSTVQEACAALSRLPVHMSYSVTVMDAGGHHATVFLNPDRPAEVLSQIAVTNHQHHVEWDEHAAFTRTRERQEILEALANNHRLTRNALLHRFLRAPLHSRQFFQGFATLYTAAYDVRAGSVRIIWPDRRLEASFDHFEEQQARVTLFRPVGRTLAK